MTRSEFEKIPNLQIIKSRQTRNQGKSEPKRATAGFQNVSNLAAEVALEASLEDCDGLLERVRKIVAERDRFMGLLEQIPGVKPWPSQANFILCQLPEGRGKEIFEGLCQRGIFLRYFTTPRLQDCMRASVGLPHETDAVVEALRELVGGENSGR